MWVVSYVWVPKGRLSMLLKFPGMLEEHVEVQNDWQGVLEFIAALDWSKILCINLEKGKNGNRLISIHVPLTEKVHVLNLLEIRGSGAGEIQATHFVLSLVLANKDMYGFDLCRDDKWLIDEGFLDYQGLKRNHDLRSCLA